MVSKVNEVRFDNWQGQKLFYLNDHLPLVDTRFADDLVFVDYFNGFLGEQDNRTMFTTSFDYLKKGLHEKPDIYKKHKWTQRYFIFKQKRISSGAEDSLGITQDNKSFFSNHITMLKKL